MKTLVAVALLPLIALVVIGELLANAITELGNRLSDLGFTIFSKLTGLK